MGWKGTVRSLAAASRRAARESARRAKEAEKERLLAEARETVQAFEEYIEQLTSLHKRVSRRPIDWSHVASSIPPVKPLPQRSAEELAISKLATFKPNLLHRILGSEAKKRAKLEQAVVEASEKDRLSYEKKCAEYEVDLKKYEADTSLAKRVNLGEAKALSEVVSSRGRFEEIELIGTHISFKFDDGGFVSADLHVHGDEIVPNEKYSLLRSGRLSEKNMPKGEFNLIYQDYVCGALLRIAREVLNLLPVDGVVVNAKDDLLNRATGHLEQQVIASAYIARSTVDKLNFSMLDPSDAMENFLHNMHFKKTTGFGVVEQVNNPQRSRE